MSSFVNFKGGLYEIRLSIRPKARMENVVSARSLWLNLRFTESTQSRCRSILISPKGFSAGTPVSLPLNDLCRFMQRSDILVMTEI